MYTPIFTKFLNPTNTKGARVKAYTDNGKSRIFPWRHEMNSQDNHIWAAKLLAEELEWDGEWYGGGIKEGFVFVCSNDWVVNTAFLVSKD